MNKNYAPAPRWQFFDNNGDPLSGGLLYTYRAGTVDEPLDTYTDYIGAEKNTNPVVLDSRGEASIWLGEGSYKFELHDADDVLIWSEDHHQSQYGVTTVDTIADLRAMTGMVSGQIAQPLGWAAKGDGGGGPQRVFARGGSPGSYVDDNGYVIVPTGGDGSEAWVLNYAGSDIPALWSGGDINAAISYCAGQGGGRVILDPHSFGSDPNVYAPEETVTLSTGIELVSPFGQQSQSPVIIRPTSSVKKALELDGGNRESITGITVDMTNMTGYDVKTITGISIGTGTNFGQVTLLVENDYVAGDVIIIYGDSDQQGGTGYLPTSKSDEYFLFGPQLVISADSASFTIEVGAITVSHWAGLYGTGTRWLNFNPVQPWVTGETIAINGGTTSYSGPTSTSFTKIDDYTGSVVMASDGSGGYVDESEYLSSIRVSIGAISGTGDLFCQKAVIGIHMNGTYRGDIDKSLVYGFDTAGIGAIGIAITANNNHAAQWGTIRNTYINTLESVAKPTDGWKGFPLAILGQGQSKSVNQMLFENITIRRGFVGITARGVGAGINFENGTSENCNYSCMFIRNAASTNNIGILGGEYSDANNADIYNNVYSITGPCSISSNTVMSNSPGASDYDIASRVSSGSSGSISVTGGPWIFQRWGITRNPTTQVLDATDTINVYSGGIIPVKGNGSAVTLTGSPSISGGKTNQIICLVGDDSTYTVTIKKNVGFTGEGHISQAGGASTITFATTELAVDDVYNTYLVKITSGTGANQVRTISDYVGSTRVATVSVAWTTPPDNTSHYVIYRNYKNRISVNSDCILGLGDALWLQLSGDTYQLWKELFRTSSNNTITLPSGGSTQDAEARATIAQLVAAANKNGWGI